MDKDKFHTPKTGRFSCKTPNPCVTLKANLPYSVIKGSDAIVESSYPHYDEEQVVDKPWYKQLFIFIKIFFCFHKGEWEERTATYMRECTKCGWVSVKTMSLKEFQQKRKHGKK